MNKDDQILKSRDDKAPILISLKSGVRCVTRDPFNWPKKQILVVEKRRIIRARISAPEN